MKRKPPNLKAIGAGVAVALVVSVLGYLTLIAPQRSEASKLSDDIAATQQQIDEARLATRSVGPPARVDDVFRFSKAMPDTVDMPGIMLELSRIATETGIEFDSIKPAEPAAGAPQSIDLVFEGNFYELSDFLFRLRNLVALRDGRFEVDGRLFTVDKLDFTKGVGQPLKATLTASAYVYGGAAAESAPAGAAAAPAPAAPAAEGTG